MDAKDIGTGKQTPKPNTARPSVRDLIKDAENRHAKLDRTTRIKAAKSRHWQKRKKNHARIFGTLPRSEYNAIAKRAIAQGRFRRRKDGPLQANVFEQVISEARCYQAQTFLPPKDIERLINRLCHWQCKTDPGGKTNLTHRSKCLFQLGGGDADNFGPDGNSGFKTARHKHSCHCHCHCHCHCQGDGASTRRSVPRRPEKLDPYKGYITKRMAAAAPDVIPATVLLREIQGRGYDGGYTRLKEFVRGLRPAPKLDPVVRIETDPGAQMQADWANISHGGNKLKVFIATLGWSRTAYVEFCDILVRRLRLPEKVETLIACHEHAFQAFAGVPEEVLYDSEADQTMGWGPIVRRTKTVVLERIV